MSISDGPQVQSQTRPEQLRERHGHARTQARPRLQSGVHRLRPGPVQVPEPQLRPRVGNVSPRLQRLQVGLSWNKTRLRFLVFLFLFKIL